MQALVINGFSGHGIDLLTNGGNVIVGDYIGTDVTGTVAMGNGGAGVVIQSDANLVGGTSMGARDLISGNAGYGISILGSGNIIQGNFIGTDASGTQALGNGGRLFGGVYIGNSTTAGNSNNTLGGTAPGAGNLISGNPNIGILEANSRDDQIQGNKIGTDVTGTQALGNGSGVYFSFIRDDTIGGTAPTAGNLISGNTFDGIFTTGTGSVILGNRIGTDVTGTRSLGNNRGIFLDNSNNTVGGTAAGAGNLISGNRGDGILISGNGITGNLVASNWIGTNAAGTTAVSNGGNGVDLAGGTHDNTIGGTDPAARNVISGNDGEGVRIFKTDNLFLQNTRHNFIEGNYIGTDVTGAAALGNHNSGIFIPFSQDNVISGNLVAGNFGFAGIAVCAHSPCGGLTSTVGDASGNLIVGNKVGTDATGTHALGNQGHGISIDGVGGTGIVVGGTTPDARNLISGNLNVGVEFFNNATATVVEGNYIGTDVTGTAALGNGVDGVRLDTSASGNTVGGTAAGAGNTIAFNGRDGVLVDTGTGNAILRNRIFGHDNGLGIELINGGNNDQASPTLTSAVFDGSTTTIAGTLTSVPHYPDSFYTIEIFVNSACNPSGFGEGEQFFAALTVTTDDNGNAAFTLALPVEIDPSQFLSATATLAFMSATPYRDTSAFSQCREVTAPELPGFSSAELHGAVVPRAAFGSTFGGVVSFDPHPGTSASLSLPIPRGDLEIMPMNRTVGQAGSDLFFGTVKDVRSRAATAWTEGLMDRAWDELTIRNPFFD